MSKGSDPPWGGQRGRARRDPTREQWAQIASEETQRVIRIAVARFMARWPNEDPNEAQGVALDAAVAGTVDYIPEAGLAYHSYIARRVGWSLLRSKGQRWKRAELASEHYENPAEAPELNPDAWEMLEASRRLRLQQSVIALLPALPFDHRWIIEQHYLKGKTLVELGKELGISTTGANRLHQAALSRLRTEVAKRGL